LHRIEKYSLLIPLASTPFLVSKMEVSPEIFFLPYIIWFIFCVLCSFLACKLIPIVAIERIEFCQHEFSMKSRIFSVLLGKSFRCQKCGALFIYSRSWASALAIFEVTAFMHTAAASVFFRSYYPYLAFIMFFILCSYFTYKFIPIRPLE
jgi:hypothetical protein